MKKTLALVLALLMVVVAIAACGGSSTPAPSSEAPAPSSEAPAPSSEAPAPSSEAPAPSSEAPAPGGAEMVDTTQYKKDGPYTIGWSSAGHTNDYSNCAIWHGEYVLETLYKDKVEKVIWSFCDNDENVQINQIDDMLAKGIDILIVEPMSASSGVATLEKAMDMGVPVVVVGSGIESKDAYVEYVNIDNEDFGYQTAKWICDQIGGKGKVLKLLGEPGSGYTENYDKGATRALAEYPDVEVVSVSKTKIS